MKRQRRVEKREDRRITNGSARCLNQMVTAPDKARFVFELLHCLVEAVFVRVSSVSFLLSSCSN